jgi:hypothetical protein
MTRQEERETHKAITAEAVSPKPISQPSGVHKLNTRNRGKYNGLTTAAVLKLLRKKKGYVYSNAEKDAMTAYYDERLANMGCSMSAGTPDWLKYEGMGGVLLDLADKEYVIDEKKRFDKSKHTCAMPPLPGESLTSDCVCEDKAEVEAVRTAWTVNVGVTVMAGVGIDSMSSRISLQFAAHSPEHSSIKAQKPAKDRKPTKRRGTRTGKRKEHEDAPYDVRIVLDGALGWRGQEGAA